MSTASETPQPAAKNQNRRKKARAIMASGLVLGVGAAVTLAAWSDTVWGQGTFGTENSAFNIQADFGSGWDEFITADKAGVMNFGSEANDMMPKDTLSTVVGLREEHENMDAKVTLTKVNGNSGKLGDWITLGVSAPLTEKPATCEGVAAAQTTLLKSQNAQMATFDLAAGETRWFCFSVALHKDTPADASGTTTEPIQWRFDAQSVEKTPAQQ